MRNKRLNHNKDIMLGVMALAIVVLAVVVVFWMWCFPDGTPQPPSDERAVCKIRLEGFRGDSIQLQLNDSLFFSQAIGTDTATASVGLHDETCVLMVMQPLSDRVSSFELPADASSISLQKHDENIKMEIVEQKILGKHAN